MKETLLKLKLKKSEDRGGTYYLTTFIEETPVVVDSWERPELFRELLKFWRESSEIKRTTLNSRHNPLPDNK